MRARRPSGAREAAPGTPGRRAPVWFFDLDDTLHDASHAIFRLIDTRMTDFVQRHLGLPRAQADALRRSYWRRYGATVLGLMRHHAVDPDRFLRETHDFEVGPHLRAAPGLRGLERRLGGRRVLLSNSPGDYAGRVLAGLGLRRFVGRRYAVEDMRVHGTLRPKPSVSMLRAVLVREGLGATRGVRRAVLVDDNLDNLRAAHRAGFVTVHVLRPAKGPRRLCGGAFVHARVRRLWRLAALAPRWRACTGIDRLPRR